MKRFVCWADCCLVAVVVFHLAGCMAPTGGQPVPRKMRDWLPQDARKNADGMSPEAERKPPLRRIADPSNLESDNAAIKQAAKIKKQEDLKDQKLKAIYYLCSIGCGCYDKDGEVTAALKESLENECTEEVRLAIVQTILATAQSGRCDACNQVSCCKKELVEALTDLAYGVDEKGCPKEPSARVRQAACEALQFCCPYAGMDYIPSVPPPRSVREPVGPDKSFDVTPETGGDVPGAEEEAAGDDDPPASARSRIRSGENARRNNAGVLRSVKSSVDGKILPVGNVESSNEASRSPGVVTMVSPSLGQVRIALSQSGSITIGQRMVVLHRYSSSRTGTTGELEITDVVGLTAMAIPVGRLSFENVAIGDHVVPLGRSR